MYRNRKSWRALVGVLAILVVLASTPAVAQASTGAPVGSSWVQWLGTYVHTLWHVVTGSRDEGGDPSPDPKPH